MKLYSGPMGRLLLGAIVLATAGLASAATAIGTVAFGFSNVSDNTPGALVPNTMFTIGSIAANADGTGSFDCTIPGPDSVCNTWGAALSINPFQGNLMFGEVLTFDGGAVSGTPQYQYKITSQAPPIVHTVGGQTFFNIQTDGAFADLRGGAGFDSGPASLSITFTQNCVGVNCSISGGASFAIPPSFTTPSPEPASMALLGAGFVCLGIIGIRRRRRA